MCCTIYAFFNWHQIGPRRIELPFKTKPSRKPTKSKPTIVTNGLLLVIDIVGIIKLLAGFLAVGKGDAVGPAKNVKVVFFKNKGM
jgi:hypothetical protein